jgi:hypothetical protein
MLSAGLNASLCIFCPTNLSSIPLNTSEYNIKMIRPLHTEARCALTIKKGDLIVSIQYGSDRMPTEKVQYAAFDTVEVVSKHMFRGIVQVRNDLYLSGTRTFKELGLPRFVIPLLRWGLWRRNVCTVPKAVALDLMRRYIDVHREPLNRGPGPFNTEEIAISVNKLEDQQPKVLTPWDREKLAS